MIGVSAIHAYRIRTGNCTILGGGGICGFPFYLKPQTVANVLLDGQFWKKDASVYSFSLRINYLFRLLVHPFFIQYHSLVYLTICN